MKSILIGLLLVSQTAFAGKLENDIQELSQLVDVGTNGGGAIVSEYDVRSFSYNPLVQNLLTTIREDQGCSMQTAIGRKQVLSGNFEILTPEATQLLRKLDKQGKLKAALGYYWNGDEGESEYCTRENLDLYFSNGQVLSIFLDSTT